MRGNFNDWIDFMRRFLGLFSCHEPRTLELSVPQGSQRSAAWPSFATSWLILEFTCTHAEAGVHSLINAWIALQGEFQVAAATANDHFRVWSECSTSAAQSCIEWQIVVSHLIRCGLGGSRDDFHMYHFQDRTWHGVNSAIPTTPHVHPQKWQPPQNYSKIQMINNWFVGESTEPKTINVSMWDWVHGMSSLMIKKNAFL
jgi:hypothetical protein